MPTQKLRIVQFRGTSDKPLRKKLPVFEAFKGQKAITLNGLLMGSKWV
jgi:hypothetical protein